jgi:DNA-binding NarL/FixJ family response regulator
MKHKIGIVDDHQLLLKSLSILINSFSLFEVTIEALNGNQLLQQLAAAEQLPDILLIDVNMPVMGGEETVSRLTTEYPQIKAAALSMKDDDMSIISMLRAGCCAYLLKDIHPNTLEQALTEIVQKGYFNADAFNINYRRLIIKANQDKAVELTTKEKEFLRLASSDRTYKQIASEMNLSERTIDGYRESLFQKLNVQSRVGMVLEGLRKNIIAL